MGSNLYYHRERWFKVFVKYPVTHLEQSRGFLYICALEDLVEVAYLVFVAP